MYRLHRDRAQQPEGLSSGELAGREHGPQAVLAAQRRVGNAAVSSILARDKQVTQLPEITVTVPVERVPQGGAQAGEAEIEAQLTRIKDTTFSLWTSYQDGLNNFQTALSFASDQETEFNIGAVFAAAGKEAFDKIVEHIAEAAEAVPVGALIIVLKEAAVGAFEEYERAEKAEGSRAIGAYITELRTAASKARTAQIQKTNASRASLIKGYEDAIAASGGPADDPHVLVGDSALVIRELRLAADEIEKRALAADQWTELFIQRFTQRGLTTLISQGGRESGILYLDVHVYRDGAEWEFKDVDSAWTLATPAPNPDRLATGLKDSLHSQGKRPAESGFEKSVKLTIENEIPWALNEYTEVHVHFVEDPKAPEFRSNWDIEPARTAWAIPIIRDRILEVSNIVGASR